jgi:hypothetical protein
LWEKRHKLVAQPSLECRVIAKLIYLNWWLYSSHWWSNFSLATSN